jgi:hypothetical protein
VSEAQVGLLQDGHWQMLAEVLYGGEAAAQELFARVCAARPPDAPPFVGFAVADARVRLTANGPVHVAPTVLMTWSRR